MSEKEKNYLVVRYITAVYEKFFITAENFYEAKSIAVEKLRTMPDSIEVICLVFNKTAYYFNRNGDLINKSREIPTTTCWVKNVKFIKGEIYE